MKKISHGVRGSVKHPTERMEGLKDYILLDAEVTRSYRFRRQDYSLVARITPVQESSTALHHQSEVLLRLPP